MIAAALYLALGEFYLAAHASIWSPARSLAVFVAILSTALYAVRCSRGSR